MYPPGMVAPIIGIDLGTTNSVVASFDDGKAQTVMLPGGQKIMPSVVSFHPRGTVLVGEEARARRVIDAQNTIYSVKRLIGRPFRSVEVKRAQERLPFKLVEGPNGGVHVEVRGSETHSLPEISAFVLRKIHSLAKQSLGDEIKKAVVTVPANFNELQRSATKAAGRVAGLDVVRIINEPTAAALAYGLHRGGRERIAVFDLGGGTFDITILQLANGVFEVMSTAGDTFLGGDDVDLLVAEQMAQRFLEENRIDPRGEPQAWERIRTAAEWLKCQLSQHDNAEVTVEEVAYGPGGSALNLTYEMNRAELSKLAHPLLARSFDVCEEAMKLASVRPTQLDAVVLVGGSTRMPLVREMVGHYFGTSPRADVDPDVVVAWGAAVQGAVLGGQPLARVALKKVRAPRAAVGAAKEVVASTHREHSSSKAGKAKTMYGMGAAPPPPPSAQARAKRTAKGVPTPPRAIGERTTNMGLGDEPQAAVSPPAPPPPAGSSDLAAVPVVDPTLLDVPVPPPPPSAPHDLRSHDALTDESTEVTDDALDPPTDADPLADLDPPAAPLLLDVTPLALGVETVNGYCEEIIPRNSPIPTEHTKMFVTARDNQRDVRVKVCQGQSKRLEENQFLGEVALHGLREGSRGTVRIEVVFELDSDGILGVHATDMGTGQRQSTQINLVGGIEEDEIEMMRARQAGRVL